MNALLWTLQIVAAILYATSGSMKVFMFDEISGDVPSFGALPRQAWMALGILELTCTVFLLVPSALRWHPKLTAAAAAILATESLVFLGVHLKYKEFGSIIMVCGLGLLMAFIAYGRLSLRPIV
ncbi:MAG: DoxX family protein [Planctomyces sp.]|nr:DoxX family protein [Planctomyces sp.]